MKYTPNYNFKKPDQTDSYNVDDFNGNMDILDTKLKEVADNTSGQEVEVIMEPGKWSEKVYSFEDTYPASQYDFTLELKYECTPQEEDAYYKASMRGGDVTVNRVRARGIQPTINIPVVLKLTKKAGAV